MSEPWRVFVISARRPMNVIAMSEHFPPNEPVTWVVPAEEAESYEATGAKDILPVSDPAPGSGRYALSKARNAAITAACGAGELCIQTDDDLRRLKVLSKTGKCTVTNWPYVRDLLRQEARTSSARLIGVPPSSNTLNAKHTRSSFGFIIASLMATNTAEVLFDETLPLKEDYDFTCRHLERFGQVSRLNWLVPDYRHYTNRGGAVSFRNIENETETTRRLLKRWPQYLKPHRTREHELSFVTPPRRTQ